MFLRIDSKIRGFLAYMSTLQNEKVQKIDFSKSEKLLEAIKITQVKYGDKAMLSDDKIRTEILYNNTNNTLSKRTTV